MDGWMDGSETNVLIDWRLKVTGKELRIEMGENTKWDKSSIEA